MKKITSIFLIGLFSIILMGCQTNTIENPNTQYCQETDVSGVYKCSKDFFAFDTQLSVTLYFNQDSDYTVDTVYNDLNDIFIEYDQLLDPYLAHEGLNNLYTINQSQSPVEVSQTLFDAVTYALDNQDIDPSSDDLLFNVALGPITDIWHKARYSEDCTSTLLFDRCPVPSMELLNQDYHTDPNDVLLDEDNLTIAFAKEDMMLDLGGFAKGYISMVAQDYLSQYDINYILNLGASNVLVGGRNLSNDDNGLFRIGVTQPEFDTIGSDYYGVVSIDDGYSVVSSGAYQRYFKSMDIDDTRYYHHIIDPRTNMPGGQALAVTIITKQTGLSDILSTAIFLMDYEDGFAYVNATDDLEAIWYFADDDIRMSDNFSDFFTLRP